MIQVKGITEVRRHWGQVLDQVEAEGDVVVIERYGEPVTALVPLNVYAELLETLPDSDEDAIEDRPSP